MRIKFLTAALLVTVILACAPISAMAGAPPPSTDGWALVPSMGEAGIELSVVLDNMDELGCYNGAVKKSWGDPTGTDPNPLISLGNGGAIRYVELTVDADPQVTWNFWVQAGAADTDFCLISPVVSFAPLDSKATATAAVTVTDDDGKPGAQADGQWNAGKLYQARYNASGWTTFAELISGPVVAPAFSSGIGSETKAPWQNIGTVTDIQSEFRFRLSAGDSASGTSSFRVIAVPEPGSITVLIAGISTLGLAIRRRRA